MLQVMMSRRIDQQTLKKQKFIARNIMDSGGNRNHYNTEEAGQVQNTAQLLSGNIDLDSRANDASRISNMRYHESLEQINL